MWLSMGRQLYELVYGLSLTVGALVLRCGAFVLVFVVDVSPGDEISFGLSCLEF